MSAPSTVDNNKKHPASKDFSCFEVLNCYCTRLYILREKLLEHVTFAQKDPEGQISWVEFNAPFHSHIIKVALTLFDKPPLLIAKWAMFVFILEVINGVSAEAFFTQKSSTEKPQRTDEERSRLTQKHAHAAKCARQHELEHANNTPTATASTPVLTSQECETEQELTMKRLTTPPPPSPPIISTDFQLQTPGPDQPDIYAMTQYCQSCNKKHNFSPFPAEEDSPPRTEGIMTCPSYGHRLHAKVVLQPADVESTQQINVSYPLHNPSCHYRYSSYPQTHTCSQA